MYATYQGQLHGFYATKAGVLWQRWEAADGKIAEKNISAAVNFGTVDPTRKPEVHEAPNGDLVVGIYGTDGVFNEARWSVKDSKWLPRTYR